MKSLAVRFLAGTLFLLLPGHSGGVAAADATIARFPVRSDSFQLDRSTHSGAFFDVVGRRSAIFGYESRSFEAWVYPLKILDDFALSFRLEGCPLDIDGRDIMASIHVRADSTTLVYAHAAFTVRQIMFAPLDEQGIAILLDVDSVLPLTITASFRPRLRLMWPAASMTGGLSWDADAHVYTISDETGRYAGVIGSPSGRDVSVMPYQEEPRDIPNRFVIEAAVDPLKERRIPIVIAGSVESRAAARATYDRILGSLPSLYEATADHYERLDRDTLSVTTPDDRLNTAFRWAKVGIDKGLATNPLLGTGLVAGFRTSGDSERPGFAWFFGRDALWTALATTSYGGFQTTRAALQFLATHQRADGKIPHEVSQSAAFVPWFTGYPYAWASADATPLFVIAQADYWQAAGDRAFLDGSWPAILKAYEFSRATDRDGNGLIDNTNVGHGWVEGGALYPAHEEIYLQGLWIEAQRAIAALAYERGDLSLAAQAQAGAERTRAAVESTFWLEKSGHYAFATRMPTATPSVAEPGPERARRQAALDLLAPAHRVDEDTVLPAVPLWWRTLDPARAEIEIDRLGSGALMTDWGARLLSRTSALYDPLSYHYGSVWPLFTGWVSMAAYRYGRPHVGYQALMANALRTEADALGSITELISGEFDTPFGRSAHHQIWSQAMVASPLVHGLLGIEVSRGGSALTIAPQLPADWRSVRIRRVVAGGARFNLDIERTDERYSIGLNREGESSSVALVFAPALPLDANVKRVMVGGRQHPFTIEREGNIQRVRVAIDQPALPIRLDIAHDAGTDVVVPIVESEPGAESEGIRILRVMPERAALGLNVEGRGQRTYTLTIYSSRAVGSIGDGAGVTLLDRQGRAQTISIRFPGSPNDYVRRNLRLPLK